MRLHGKSIASSLARSWLAISLLAAAGCPKSDAELAPAPDAPFQVSVYVISDPGHPLAGAQVLWKTRAIATSDGAGLARVELAGAEGDSVSLGIRCPDGYSGPDKAIGVGLRRLAPGSPPPRFDVRCLPMVRTMVVGLRAEHGGNLPVLLLGKPIARTDQNGIAHFVIRAKPAEQIALTLDTSDKASEALRPQNPVLSFVCKEKDDMILLEQTFKIERKKVVVRAAPKPMPL
jgi:hypothetical protein